MARIALLGVPMDLGAGRRGVDMGPSAIRYAGLEERLVALDHTVEDMGDLPAVEAGRAPRGTNPKLHYLSEVTRVNLALAKSVATIAGDGKWPLILGGDHSIAIGVLAGLARTYQSVGVLWFDAHGDFNTDETTPSGNIHGMPLAVAVGRGSPALQATWGDGPHLDERHIGLIGVRELDSLEKQAIRQSQLRVATMTEVDRIGIRAVLERTLEDLAGVQHLHVSFDMDVVDPTEAPGVGTSHPGGITYREAHLVMEMLHESGRLGSLSVVEVNPIIDTHNGTARLAAELIASALGQRIL